MNKQKKIYILKLFPHLHVEIQLVKACFWNFVVVFVFLGKIQNLLAKRNLVFAFNVKIYSLLYFVYNNL